MEILTAPSQDLSSDAAASKPCPGVTLRVAILSLSLAALLGFLIPLIDYKLFNTFLGGTHLPPGAIAALLLLLLVVNPVLKMVSKAWAFTRNETLTIYITCLFSCLIPGHGGENFIIPNLIAPFYFATKENKWLDWLGPYLKPWLSPAIDASGSVNRAVTDGFYLGVAPGQAIPWGAWLVPLLFWGSFALVSYAMLGFLSIMLRRQWAQNEALAFPLLRLPLEMTEGMDDAREKFPAFFKNGLMWIGFGIAASIQLVNGLALYYPDVPTIQMGLDTGPLFTEAPWNQMGWLNLSIFPIAIGIAFLLTSEVALSLWFFMWFAKFQRIAAYTLGFPVASLADSGVTNDKFFLGFQQSGAYFAYVAIVLWSARHHLKHVARRALGQEKADADEAGEATSYPVAFWGFVVSFALLVVATVAAGVRIDIALALWVMYLVFAIGLTRVVIEGGMLFVMHQSLPLGILSKLFNSGPSSWLTPQNGLVPASMFQGGFAYHTRAFLMPSFVQGFKLAYDQKLNARRLGWLLAGVILVSVAVSWTQIVRLAYQNGALSMGHQWYFKSGSLNGINFVNTITQGAGSSASQNWLWLSVGAVLTWGMTLARANFSWFPLHPLGYLMFLTYPAQMLWFSTFLGWLAKLLLNRFGGNDAVKRATPLFLGLVLGDVAMMIFWLVIDGSLGRTGHLLMPG